MTEAQPFLVVILENDEKLILNENHVVTVKKGEGERGKESAILHLSTEETLVVKDPPYSMWEYDCFTRKT